MAALAVDVATAAKARERGEQHVSRSSDRHLSSAPRGKPGTPSEHPLAQINAVYWTGASASREGGGDLHLFVRAQSERLANSAIDYT